VALDIASNHLLLTLFAKVEKTFCNRIKQHLATGR